MSFILDALRKSETERRRNQGPGLTDTRYRATPNRRSLLAPILVAVLTANLVFMAAVWISRERGARPRTTTTIPLPASIDQGQPAAVAPAATTRVRPLSTEAEKALPAPTAGIAAASAGQRPVVTSAPKATDNDTTTPYVEDESDALPTMQQAIDTGVISLPPLHLDIHVFSPDPGKRFVFINSVKYKEGDKIKAGPVVERITTQGVILNDAGRQFLLPRE